MPQPTGSIDYTGLVRELDNLRAKVADLSSLIEVSIIINSTVELDRLVALVMEKAQTVMKAEASSVMLLNEEKNILECKVALGEVGDEVKNSMQLNIGEGIAGWVAEHGKPQIVPDVSTDPRFTPKVDNQTGFQTRSILAAPLIVKDKVIGVAEVINRLDGKAFDSDDLELFSTFCRQVAMAIENVRMYRVELEKQKLEQQLEAARFIQESFMPGEFPNAPGQKFSVAARSLPARAIGGDFFDLVEFDNGTIGVAVGDVTGKGVPAALYMARILSDFRIYAKMYEEPPEVVKLLNNLLVDRSRRGMFVTFQYGLLNTASGEFRYVNAGHIPFIHVANGGGQVQLLDGARSVPLGILPDLALQEESLRLNKGDVVVLITDGILEAKNTNGETFSLAQVFDQLSTPKASVDQLVEGLINRVREFARGAEQFDDLTVLAVQWQ